MPGQNGQGIEVLWRGRGGGKGQKSFTQSIFDKTLAKVYLDGINVLYESVVSIEFPPMLREMPEEDSISRRNTI